MDMGNGAVGASFWNIASAKIREVEYKSDKVLKYCKSTEKKGNGLTACHKSQRNHKLEISSSRMIFR